MATRRPKAESKPGRRPATTPEDREAQISNLAVDLAERQLLEGTASAQVITHYIKLASTRERLEQERIRNENLLLNAKVDQIGSTQRMEELYAKAIKVFGVYSGQDDEDEYED